MENRYAEVFPRDSARPQSAEIVQKVLQKAE
jgi:hypothetical protein